MSQLKRKSEGKEEKKSTKKSKKELLVDSEPDPEEEEETEEEIESGQEEEEKKEIKEEDETEEEEEEKEGKEEKKETKKKTEMDLYHENFSNCQKQLRKIIQEKSDDDLLSFLGLEECKGFKKWLDEYSVFFIKDYIDLPNEDDVVCYLFLLDIGEDRSFTSIERDDKDDAADKITNFNVFGIQFNQARYKKDDFTLDTLEHIIKDSNSYKDVPCRLYYAIKDSVNDSKKKITDAVWEQCVSENGEESGKIDAISFVSLLMAVKINAILNEPVEDHVKDFPNFKFPYLSLCYDSKSKDWDLDLPLGANYSIETLFSHTEDTLFPDVE